MEEYILEMHGITKDFPGVRALDEVHFKVKRGEIHCLVGENGAGKSTLIKVLSGVYPHGTYNGRIVLNKEEQQYKHISESEKAGIGVIYQELALIPELTIYENIFFGHEIKTGRIINWNETIMRAKKELEKVGLKKVDLSTKIKELGVGVQQLVEIAKTLSKDVKLLILDEPTAALNEEDSANLLRLLRELKQQGVTSIMISHKLKEVLAIADTITILRDGKTIASMGRHQKDVSEKTIIKHMVGREIDNIFPSRKKTQYGDVRFAVENWTVEDPVKGRDILKNVSLNVKKGEIVGLQGLMGAGRTEFALSVYGNTPKYKIKSGDIYLDGKKTSFSSPKDAIDAGVAYVSEDRKMKGLVLIQDVKFNVTIASLKKIAKGLTLDKNKEVVEVNAYKDSFGIRTPSIEQKVMNLSGGNQQKTQLAKWMYAQPQILILDEPTRGIDVGAKYEIYVLMNQLVEEGMSIIMISSELPEILGMSDRIFVMSEGRITGELSRQEASEEAIMELATQT